MKILHLITWLVPGGIETWLLNMLDNIPRSQYVMDFCCKGPSVGNLADRAINSGASVYHCPLGAAHIGYLNRLHAVIRQGSYDLVHSHLEAYSWLGVYAAHRAGIPVITSFHNTRFDPQTWTRKPGVRILRAAYANYSIRYALRRSELITGCSQEVINSLGAYGVDFQPKARVLYYGVAQAEQPAQHERQAFRVALGLPPTTPLVLHVGNFRPQKNHEGVLRVFKQVAASVPQARLLLVGDGPSRPEIERLIQELGLSGLVQLLGFRNDVQHIMGCCDVFLFPSHFEGFGLVTVEASAAGLPVVASRLPAVTEAVKDGETGCLHAIEDVEGMARSVIAFLCDPDLTLRFGSAGRDRVQEFFSLAQSAKSLTGMYHESSGNRQRAVRYHAR